MANRENAKKQHNVYCDYNGITRKINSMKKDFVIEALVVPQICSRITNQMVTGYLRTIHPLVNTGCKLNVHKTFRRR